MQTSEAARAGDLIPGDGDMARAMRERDWSASTLGPVALWPADLRAALGICLNSDFPMAILWGERRIYLYNDAAIPILGGKHPAALGAPADEVWPEIWDTIGPMIERVQDSGRACRRDDLLLLLERHGYPEECYFTFSYSAIGSAPGAAGGVLVTVIETTERVLAERRERALARLATEAARGADEGDALEALRAALDRHADDLPLSALFLAQPDGTLAPRFLAGQARARGADAARDVLARLAGHAAQCANAAAPLLIEAPELAMTGCGAWADAPQRLLAVPLRRPHQAGALLLGASPRRPFDSAARAFFDSVAAHVARAVAAGEARTAERARLAALEELDRSRAELARALERTSDAFVGVDRDLREASELLAAVFDRAPGGIVITDLAGGIVRVNAAYERMTGYSADELRRLTAVQRFGVTGLARLRAGQRRLLSGACSWFEVELRCRRPDGVTVWISNHVSQIDHGLRDERCFVTIAQDVTERRRVEREREASQRELRVLYERLQTVRESERTALAREVHDQLGQILSAAKIDIKLLEDDLRGARGPLKRGPIIAELGSASATLERALSVVRDIATELRAPELDEQGLYGAIAWHARDFERRTRITCELSFDPGQPHPRRAAAVALLRIFQEALTNALRHAQANRIWISLGARGAALVLRVRDDGVGIARAQVHALDTLGLRGMRERAELAGGRVLVGALRPRGTLVAARVPLQTTKGSI
jgi:PAS domain S-box-containing protein